MQPKGVERGSKVMPVKELQVEKEKHRSIPDILTTPYFSTKKRAKPILTDHHRLESCGVYWNANAISVFRHCLINEAHISGISLEFSYQDNIKT